MSKISSISILLLHLFSTVFGQVDSKKPNVDVQSYQVRLEPDLIGNNMKGNVIIKFKASPGTESVIFDCGNLAITTVIGESIRDFEQKNSQLILMLSPFEGSAHEVQIFYHGSPKRGVYFSTDPLQMHTVYFTSQWMVCNDQPDDRAMISMEITVPDHLMCMASGELISKKRDKGKVIYTWDQQLATPSYTYGLVVGDFTSVQKERTSNTLKYFSHVYDKNQLELIFGKTPDILAFLEEKSDVPYFQKTYTQVLIGNDYQEMSGLSVLKETYGQLVLKDSTETNLITHELAHQWWGNMITCENWNHFWLNEAMATFMSAAYNEHRFGQQKYEADIEAYREVYEKIKAKGADKSLVFESWISPTRDDRNIVYFKGAYVLHLLRIELGDQVFWDAIRHYSKTYFGQSVSTQQFQKAIEESSKRDLNQFFNKWVYAEEK